MKYRIILGSSSIRRVEIMKTVVDDFEIISPDIDETRYRQPSAQALTLATALAKAEAIARRVTEPAIIITADTVVRMADGIIREKPESAEQIRDWLHSYKELKPKCITSVVGYRTSDAHHIATTDTATISFRWFSEERIREIIADGTAMGCSGAFTMEHPLFKGHVLRVWGDPECIQGLPSRLVRAHLTILMQTWNRKGAK